MDLTDSQAAIDLVDAVVERAIEPYRALLEADALAEMRRALRDTMLLHPTYSRYVARLIPAPQVLESETLGGEAGLVKDLGGGEKVG